ncbi:PQQ-binding-like beta-propeller repeat protein [Nocardioides sp. NPDC126508]
MWIPPPPPGAAYAAAPQKKASRAGLWLLIGGGLTALVVLAAVAVGAFLVLGPDSRGGSGSDTAETAGSNSDIGALTSEPNRSWAWKSSETIRWAVAGPGFTIALLEGKAGLVVLDDQGKERWRPEKHEYSGAWVDTETKTIEASWYGPVSTTANGSSSDSGSIVWDYDGNVLWKDTGEDHYMYGVEDDGRFLLWDAKGETLAKVREPTGPGEWKIDGEEFTVLDDAVYALDGDTLARYARTNGELVWKTDLQPGWKGIKQSYEIDQQATDDLVVLTADRTFGFSAKTGKALWDASGTGDVVATAGNRLAVIEPGTYDENQGITLPSTGPYPIYDTTGKVGALPFSTSRPYAAVQMVNVDGKGEQVNFGTDDGALFDAAGKALGEDGYEHAFQALDDGVYLLDRATVSFREWHSTEDAWSLTLPDVESIGDKEHKRDVYMQVDDERLVINDKHTVWLYE